VLDGTDIILIHQLLAMYGHTMDLGDWDAFAELFVPEASIDYHGSVETTVLEGRDNLVPWFMGSNNPPAHHVTNIVVDDTADPSGPVQVHSKFMAPYTRDHHSPKRLYGGDYHDVVVKRDGRWRFLAKQCIPRWNMTVQIDDDVPKHRRTY
jgi:3-phenylpropionate/cinnamic acid dioxygenase small subunit